MTPAASGHRLLDKVVLVTGAGNGIGAATAKLFAREGTRVVVVTDVLELEGRAVAASISAEGLAAEFLPLDVTAEQRWSEVIQAVRDRYGQLDVLVNNAGLSGSAAEDLFDTDGWDRLMAVNSTGTFLGCKYAIPAMLETGGGSIVNISSISGLVGNRGLHFAYNASKGAVRLMTKGLAARYGPAGIRVNSVHPGLMPPMVSSGRTVDPKVRARLMEGVPLQRTGELVEVAAAVLFLASDESSYITGAELVVDGGYTAV